LVGCATTGEWTTKDTEDAVTSTITTIGEILFGVFAQ
jgi:hypothetical protein